jgi:hypothetical protein
VIVIISHSVYEKWKPIRNAQVWKRTASIANVYLFQTPVPNYTDVDLSFSYEVFHSAIDFATMDQSTAYEFIEQMIPVMIEMIDKQLSSPQLQEFIRLEHLSELPTLYS